MAGQEEKKAIPMDVDEGTSSSAKEDLLLRKTHIVVKEQSVHYAETMEGAHDFRSIGLDNSFSLDKFKELFKIVITKLTADDMEFDLIGVDAPIANALRRILLSEVPTMAIERVYITANDSVIPDEVLAHRLGLIPLRIDPEFFEYRKEGVDAPEESNTIVFTLDVKCERKKGVAINIPEEKQYEHSKVYSRDLVWKPQGSQEQTFKDQPIAPVLDDILIAKLRPGQSIKLEAHCCKGIGWMHAKWSPVATASYRLLPDIQFATPIVDEDADQLKTCCTQNVFSYADIEDTAQRMATVSHPRNCTLCRECIRSGHPWSDKIKLMRVKNHFLFSIESTGAVLPQVLLRRAILKLKEKCSTLKTELSQ